LYFVIDSTSFQFQPQHVLKVDTFGSREISATVAHPEALVSLFYLQPLSTGHLATVVTVKKGIGFGLHGLVLQIVELHAVAVVGDHPSCKVRALLLCPTVVHTLYSVEQGQIMNAQGFTGSPNFGVQPIF
jgi:hypothetical protein